MFLNAVPNKDYTTYPQAEKPLRQERLPDVLPLDTIDIPMLQERPGPWPVPSWLPYVMGGVLLLLIFARGRGR